jgi:hypothetical protein
MNMRCFTLVIVLLALLSHGCATSYQPHNPITGGFSETRLAPDVLRIVFRGNSSTREERAKDLAMMRAAELALQSGYPYFVLADQTTRISKDNSGYVPNSISMPTVEIVVQFLRSKNSDGLIFDTAFLFQSLKGKYQVK